MIANGKPKVDLDNKKKPKSLLSRIKTWHIFLSLGLFSVFLGYISVAPPTDLPNWPLYQLNSKVWQSFESWGKYVKPYHLRVMTAALQHLESRALYMITYMNVPDILHRVDKPLSCEELKDLVDQESGLEPISLPFFCRVLHAASHFDILQEESEHKYSLTPLSQYLVTSHPKSLKNYVLLYAGDESLVISTALSRSMYSGLSGFMETYRVELLPHLKEDPMFREIYDRGQGDSSRLHAPAIIADYPPFSSCKHICDIGGGVGSFLNELLTYYAHGIEGTNFDLPDVIATSKGFLSAKTDGTKINLIAGNFTKKIPKTNCDCFILKDILQNWSDEDASLILNKLFDVVEKGNRVLIIETILHTGSFSEERLKSLMDLTMMALNPSHSRLRTEEEIYFLLEQSGFVEAQTYPTRAGYSIVEAFPTKH